MKTELEKNKDK